MIYSAVRIQDFSFRGGKKIVVSKPGVYASILAALINAQEAARKRSIDFRERKLHQEFKAEGWRKNNQVEFLSERIAVEIEFFPYELLYRNYFRLISAYKAHKIDAGVVIINPADGLNRVKADLAWLRGTITVPIWVIALK